MATPPPETPVTRGFAAVETLAAATGSPDLARLAASRTVGDERHRADVLAEIGTHLAGLTHRDPTAHDLERFVPILELVPAGVVIRTATDATPAPRFYGGY
jgi:hypothetical protein